MRTGAGACVLLAAAAWAAPAAGQQAFEVAGARALGMAGAFVAVADDATAVHWNPAGLATAGPLGATFEWHRFQNGNRDGVPVPGPGQGATTFSSLGSWPLGLSFGRFSSTALVAGPGGATAVETLSTRQFGVTVLQTLVEGLVVGSTLKFMRGSVASAPPAGLTVADALDFGADLDSRTSGAFDLDIGVMADLQRFRVGLTWKNLRTPEFGGDAGIRARLPKLARLGVAAFPVDGLTLAMDVDLDTVDLRDGLRRMIAFGGESRLGGRLMVRGGVRWSLEGLRRPVTALGASVALRRGLWLDGHWSHGRSDEDRGFGFALRAGY